MRCRLYDSDRLLSVHDRGATPPCESFLTTGGGYAMRMPRSIDAGIAVRPLPLAETSHHWFDGQQRHPVTYCQRKTVE